MKTRTTLILTLTFIITLTEGNAFGKYSGGTGDPSDPYQIADANDLLLLAADANDYGKCFILTADIDMEGQVFTTAIIAADTNSNDGFQGTDFTGTFDGNNHKITHFAINGGINGFLGIFGMIYVGSVENLGLENCAVSGDSNSQCIGGLVGQNGGNIINCYSTGMVSGDFNSSNFGGLVGLNSGNIINCYSTGTVSGSSGSYCVGGLVGQNGGNIINCYSTGTVSGSSSSFCFGGLVGANFGNISNCYSTGAVNGSSSSSGVGGLVGLNQYGGISNCYSTGMVSGNSSAGGLVGSNFLDSIVSSFWDTQTSGRTTSAGGTGKTTAEMKTLLTFTSTGWDFVNETINGTCNYWQMSADSYPVLSIFNGYIPPEPKGSGTPENPYIIADANDLGTIWYRPAVNYILANDINLAGISWSMAVVPVFNGVLDGKGFCVKNLSINGAGYLGLFGSIEGGSVKKIGIKNCTVSGGSWHVGGLVGVNINGSISNCYSTGAVIGSSYSYFVGGLVGDNYNFGNGRGISNCYSMGTVSGNSYVGGLVGSSSDSISNSYSTGTVSGSRFVGGLVANNYGSVSNSFWDTQTSGQSTSAGGTGKTTAEMKTLTTFISAGWDFTNETVNDTNDYWRMCVDGINYPHLNWESIAGDFACPDGVNIEDLSYFFQRWIESDCASSNNCGGVDIDASDIVDFRDFAMFAENWLNGE